LVENAIFIRYLVNRAVVFYELIRALRFMMISTNVTVQNDEKA
jgi:hypothetical protein